MEMQPFEAKAGPDRFATSDEIRAALSFLPDSFMESAEDKPWEVASDFGGYVLIETEEDHGLTLLEKLDATVN